MTLDPNVPPSAPPPKPGRISAAVALPFFLLAMYCAYKAMSRQHQDDTPWGIGASAAMLAGVIIARVRSRAVLILVGTIVGLLAGLVIALVLVRGMRPAPRVDAPPPVIVPLAPPSTQVAPH